MSDRAATRKLLLFVLHPAGLRFRGGVVRVRTIEPHAFSPPALIELRADDVPALAQVQDAMLQSGGPAPGQALVRRDRKSTRLNSSHVASSYAVFCLKKKKCKRLTSVRPGP